MTRSQYYRSLAVQAQAKASDQWAYYQAKRSRSVEAGNMLDILGVSSHAPALDKAKLLAAVTDADLRQTLDSPDAAPIFSEGSMNLSAPADKPIADASVQKALADVNAGQDETSMASLLRGISDDQMTAAEQLAQTNLAAFDDAINALSKALDKLHTTFDSGPMQAGVIAARLRFNMARYDREAAYNQLAAELFEVEVHRNGVESDRRRVRSSYFFYGMLISQAAVMIATFSLAGQKPGALWILAALTGAAAAMFGGYVYFSF